MLEIRDHIKLMIEPKKLCLPLFFAISTEAEFLLFWSNWQIDLERPHHWYNNHTKYQGDNYHWSPYFNVIHKA